MSYSYNHIVLVGRATKSPELVEFGGHQKATFVLAVDRNYRKDDGSCDTDFIWIVMWGRMAEVAAQYITKGRPVLVDGRLQVRAHKKEDTTRWFTEVSADNFKLLDAPQSVRHDNVPSTQEEMAIEDVPVGK